MKTEGQLLVSERNAHQKPYCPKENLDTNWEQSKVQHIWSGNT